jgi:hypothetical protein
MSDNKLENQPHVPVNERERHHDAALVLAKARLNAIPLVGGSLASLVEFIPTVTRTNTEKAIGFFRDQLADLATRIDVDAVDKEEFSELFKSCSRIMERTHRDEKLRAAANILANLLLKPGDQAKVSYDELDHLIRCVDALSIGAITVLGAIRQVSATHPLGSNVDAIQFGQLRTRLPMNAALLRSLVSELQAFHLVTAQETAIMGFAEEEYDGSHLRISPIGSTLIERFIEGNM